VRSKSAPKKPSLRLRYWIFEAKKRLPDAENKPPTGCHNLKSLFGVVNIVIRRLFISNLGRWIKKAQLFGVLVQFCRAFALHGVIPVEETIAPLNFSPISLRELGLGAIWRCHGESHLHRE
jgi:hypothetical protein